MAKGHDRVLAPYDFDEPSVDQLNLTVEEFFRFCDNDKSDERARDKTMYLQHCIVKPAPPPPPDGAVPAKPAPASMTLGRDGVEMRPTFGLGKRMRADITDGIDRGFLEKLRAAGRLGPWISTVLFVGGRTAGGARTRLHFDQVDNLYLQVSGVKRFRIFDPRQSGCLAPYPWHHPMDRSAQVDLRDIPRSAKLFPQFAEARGAEVELKPGDLLFLPAYWWHEVLTDAAGLEEVGSHRGLTVSVNFWFSAAPKLQDPQPSVPLCPMLEAELARQMEMSIADALGDRGAFVPPFLRALGKQLAATTTGKQTHHGSTPWSILHAHRPAGVDSQAWSVLFEYLVAKLCLWLPSPGHLLPFLRRHCDASRFNRLLLMQR